MLKNLKNLTIAELEQKILKFWQENKIFEKSLTKNSKPKAKSYAFYDGPPFATGLPHYGHILASIIKDAVPRYKTMKGFRVPRRWGWDCHGLPIEIEIEKELNLQAKKDIEKFGVEKFNEAAKTSVLRYADEWKKIIPRIGRWVDMENDYKTMDSEYTESVWWIFKNLYKKGLVYEDFRVTPYCPRCGTPLSNFELNQPGAYRNIEDQSIYVKFQIPNLKSQIPTYFFVWTTTPWTLPGNAALAVNNNFDYVKIKLTTNNQQQTTEYFILAKERLSVIDGEYEILEKYKGKDLVGLKYEPLYKVQSPKSKVQSSYKVVAADFVSAEDGTGIVHIAPAFGEDDMEVGRKENLPTLITVDLEGKIIKGLGIPGEGLFVKKADEFIKKDLSDRGLLFKEEKIVHSYPHCWRCETPLFYFPVNSWYIAVKKIKKRLIENNKKIHWVPEHLKTGRFGKWLEEVRDWDVARSRFWGAPIPVWKCEKCEKIKAIGSLGELKENSPKSGNHYFVMRHGEAESNVENIANADLKNNHYHLTDKGREQAVAAAGKLKKERIDLIFTSDFARTRETAEIIAERLGLGKKKIIFDKRLREVNIGIFEGKNVKEYRRFVSIKEKFSKAPAGGENLTELKNRVSEFLYEIDGKYESKKILIVSHEYPIWLLAAGAAGADAGKAIRLREDKTDFIKFAEIKNFDFVSLPHNKNFELDLHRPYIDGVELKCPACGEEMKRIPEVFDCWFESGAMPFASAHFPFAFNIGTSDVPNIDKKNIMTSDVQKFPFPAEFIAEGIDQTRGWFYTLLVLSAALFNKPAYKNVIVNGIILAENGEKMSKRLKNYPDPMDVIEKYGADALRYYLISSPAVRGESLNFSEKGVDEVYKKVILRLWNVYLFYEMYAGGSKLKTKSQKLKTKNTLDRWILSRLEELKSEVSKWLDKYELDKAARPIGDFVDDLSTWYIRRSRDRFKVYEAKPRKDAEAAVLTTRFILLELSKIIAPFMPFMAEAIYQNLTSNLRPMTHDSVHLETWPITEKSKVKSQKSKVLLEAMAEIRRIASLALEARQKAGIKVRQPLASLKIRNQELGIRNQGELLNLIKDEVNVKKIVFDGKIQNEVEIDTHITPELKSEGNLRELARMVQDLRKEAGFTPKDKIFLYLETSAEIERVVSQNISDFKSKIGAKNIEFKRTEKFDAEEETQIDGQKIWIGIKKV